MVKPHSEFVKNGNCCIDGLTGRCKLCQSAAKRAWDKRNPASKARQRQEWRDRARPHVRRKAVEYAATRRARILGQFIERVNPEIVYEMHGGMCGICKEFVRRDEFEVDHVIPLACGGMHGYINVQPAHLSCNRSKGSAV